MKYLIRFDFPEGTMWAGWAGNGTLGYAPTPRTAAEFDSREAAEATAKNSYGPETASYAVPEQADPIASRKAS